MSYLDFKKKLLHITGRFDLVTDLATYANANLYGVDDVVWSGQRLLESMVSDRRRQFSWERKDVVAGSIKLNVRNVRVINEVWLADSSGKTLLSKRPLSWLRENYGELSELSQATPLYWAPAVNKLSPNQASLTSATYTTEFSYDADDINFDDTDWSYDTILFYPPANQTYTISVLGKFWEKRLTANSDVNFWTEQFEQTLIEAARYILERNQRNRAGAEEHLAYIRADLKGLLDDFLDEELAGVNQQAG